MKPVLLVLLVAAAATAQLTPQQKAEKEGCMEGYGSFSDRCYKIHTVKTSVNWATAEQECQKIAGGHLMTFHSYNEIMAFYRTVSRYDRMWIGLDHPVRYGDFKWTDGTPVRYTRFTSSSYEVKRGYPGAFTYYQGYMYKSGYTSRYNKFACQTPRAGVSLSSCGATFKSAMSGNFTSPQFPANYKDNDFCRWAVLAPTNHSLTVTVHSFDSERHRDILNVYTNTSLHAVFQGYYPFAPIQFTVDSDVLNFIWKTDPIDNNNKGFEISFRASDCPKLWDIMHGNVSFTGIQSGDKASYTCKPGFVLNGTAQQMCKVGGWSAPVPACQRLECPRLASPDHGRYQTLNRYGYQFEGMLRLTCDTGYQINNLNITLMVRNCTDDGVWSGPTLQCLPVNCGPFPQTTTRALAKIYGKGTSYGTVIRASCVYGVRTGNAERTCQANGAWSGSPVYCNEAVTCDFKYHSCALKDEYMNGRNRFARVTEEYTPNGGDVCELVNRFTTTSNTHFRDGDALAYNKAYASSTTSCNSRCASDPMCTACVFYDQPNSCYLFQRLKDHSTIYRRYAYTSIRKCNALPRMVVRSYNKNLLPARLVSGQYISKCARGVTFEYYMYSSRTNANASLKVIQSEVSPFIGKSKFNLIEDITGPVNKIYDQDKWTTKTVILPKIANADFTAQRVIFEVDNMSSSEVSIRNVKLQDNCYVPPTATTPGSRTPGPTTIF